MVPNSLCALSATEILEFYKNDTITVENYMHAVLERVKERNDVVQAWTYYSNHQIGLMNCMNLNTDCLFNRAGANS